jgi:ankyrin repeat protein
MRLQLRYVMLIMVLSDPKKGFKVMEKNIIKRMYENDNAPMLEKLLMQGFDFEQIDDFGNTPLITAAEYGAAACVKVLIGAGAGVCRANSISEQAIGVTQNLEIVRLLVAAGADLNKMDKEARATMLGYSVEGVPNVTAHEYNVYKHRRFGTKNPEISQNPFWYAMVRCGASAYRGKSFRK